MGFASGSPSALLGRRKLFGLMLGGATAVLLVGCGKAIPTYRYRMTVEVDTPQGVRSGSSVIEVGGHINSDLAPGEARGRAIRSVKGEAIGVGLPDGKMLFALMVSDRDADYMAAAALTAADGEPWFRQKLAPDDLRKRQEKFLAQPRPIPRYFRRTPSKNGVFDNYPIFVTFGDLKDPQSIKRVDPDDLGSAFGEGIRLRRITVQMTDAPVSHRVQKYLPWIERAEEIPFPAEFEAQNQTFGDYRRFFIMEGK